MKLYTLKSLIVRNVYLAIYLPAQSEPLSIHIPVFPQLIASVKFKLLKRYPEMQLIDRTMLNSKFVGDASLIFLFCKERLKLDPHN